MNYEVSHFDTCALGMERLRDHDEFILIAYLSEDSTPLEILEQWHDDVESCARSENFNLKNAHEAIDHWTGNNLERIRSEIEFFKRAAQRGDLSFDDEDLEIPFRLYVRESEK